METKTIVILTIVLIITLYITYYIIKAAVSAANKQTERFIRVLINLKSEELRRAGMSTEEIKAIVYSLKD
jgi:hypothetical protein